MLRKSALDEVENHERWLVSYADFITLLFAFFVVMYSVSQVNEGKYRVMSKSLEEAFVRSSPKLNPIDLGSPPTVLVDPIKGEMETQIIPKIQDGVASDDEQGSGETDEAGRVTSPLIEIEQTLKARLDSVIETGLISIRRGEQWLEVDMKSGLLFQSGSANLNPSAGLLIEALGEVIQENQQKIRIRGYTDNQQIANEYFASNWELSAARAAHVVRRLQIQGINPARMAVEGFGQFQPIASNDNAAGRAQNRRVVLAISNETYQEKLPLTAGAVPGSGTADSNLANDGTAGTSLTNKTRETASETEESEYEIIKTPSGGLLIRAKKAKNLKVPSDNSNSSEGNP